MAQMLQEPSTSEYKDIRDLKLLFDDYLTEFCSCMKILQQDRLANEFHHSLAYEFYQRQTSAARRVQCLQEMLRLVKQQICNLHYEHIRSQNEITFKNFLFNLLKFILDDYGLDTLDQFSVLLFNLIDYSSFSFDDPSPRFQIINHYSCIPRTPLYHLLQQRLRIHLYQIKQQSNELDLQNFTLSTMEIFEDLLIKSIIKDEVLMSIISPSMVRSYIHDTVRILGIDVEKSFDNNTEQYEKTIDFITDWFSITTNQTIGLLAHAYTFFEYNQQSLLSLYSISRLIYQLDVTKTLADDFIRDYRSITSMVKYLFDRIFDYLWNDLRDLCSSDRSIDQWIYYYTIVFKYYRPSDTNLSPVRYIDMRNPSLFMSLAYVIFLNETIPRSKRFVFQLLQDTQSMQVDDSDQRSISVKSISIIIGTVQKHLRDENVVESTVMMDVQKWIISILKSASKSSEEEIKTLLRYLNPSICKLSLPINQFLFDGLIDILFQQLCSTWQRVNFWDRVYLLPVICSCMIDDDIHGYQLFYHLNQRQTLVGLFFFYLRRIASEDLVTPQLITKIVQSRSPSTKDAHLVPIVKEIYRILRDYFLVEMTALLYCQEDQDGGILHMTINQYLAIDSQSETFSLLVQHFLSIIISKKSWNYLLNLLKSEHFQRINEKWSNTLYILLETKYLTSFNQSLQSYHLLDFTLSTNNSLSIFPELHQPYNDLSKVIDQCVQTDDQSSQHWKSLSDWIQSKCNTNLTLTQIKVMLLLHIYYNYYCTNRLRLLDGLLEVIEQSLQMSSEELRVFRGFLQPERYLIGYAGEKNEIDENQLNRLFKVDFTDDDELPIRHLLVNLLAMILLGGKQNFLWTFAFEPLKLTNTYGFGSTSDHPIVDTAIHYDSGCVLNEYGALIHFSRHASGTLSVPSIYVVYFSTFGALAWHLLLFDDSVRNLYGPILSRHAIDEPSSFARMMGNNIRAKVCHFVRARFFATYHHLSIHNNLNDACILFNRCFEQMARLTQPENHWIKPVYSTLEEKFQADIKYTSEVFYRIYQQLPVYKILIHHLHFQSQMQTDLQDFISQMPMTIEFRHFQTQLSNRENDHLPLVILRKLFASFEFLRMTSFVYDLSRFYLLLHRTYTQLIEADEFYQLTLHEFCERGQKFHSDSWKHVDIVRKGIEAINAYHRFTNGAIQPGACNETEQFSSISLDSPISYLLTTDDFDEGDLIMRILSVLIDYHNSILDLLEQEIDDNSPFKPLIDQLTRRQLSIIQIVENTTGVITFNEEDYSHIQRLSQAALEIQDQHFPNSNTPLHFNFLYIQSNIIRSHLLFSRIHYHHIHKKYQYSIPQSTMKKTSMWIPIPLLQYKSLFELNINRIPLIASNLFKNIVEEQKQIRTSLLSLPQSIRFEITSIDGFRRELIWPRADLHRKLKTILLQNNTDSNEMVIVDQNQILVDFSHGDMNPSLSYLSSKYHIIPKTSLIAVILQFESNEMEFFVTATCRISSIIHYFFIKHQPAISASNEIFLSFFDEMGSCIDEDRTIEQLYRHDHRNTARIRVLKSNDDINHLLEINLTSAERDAQHKLCHPMTQVNQIQLWINTMDATVESCSFYDRIRKILLNEDHLLGDVSSTIDVISKKETMIVTLSYKTTQQSIRVLQSSSIADLLHNEYYLKSLNISIPMINRIFIRKNCGQDQILTEKDLKQRIKNDMSIPNEEIYFQITKSIEIYQYDSNQLISKIIFNENITIEQVRQMTINGDETYQYLASTSSHLVFASDEKLINLTDTKLILLRESETYVIDIGEMHQRFSISATIADVYKQNRNSLDGEYLIFDEVFILAQETPLRYFRSIPSPIRFTLSTREFEANVTIVRADAKDFSVNFQCSPSIDMHRLAQLASQLFNVDEKLYRLFALNGAPIDHSLLLLKYAEIGDHIQLRLDSKADLKYRVVSEE